MAGNFKKNWFVLSLLAVVLTAGGVLAQAPVPDAGWTPYIIRGATTGGALPVIQDNDIYATDAIEFIITETGQKAGLGTNLINGARVDQISTLHIDRLDPVATSGSLYGPYFNIWVTDGLGHYAVIANEPSDAEWALNRWDVSDWDYLSTKYCKVFETPNASTGTSWVHAYALLHGWSGVPAELDFQHVAGLIIAPPPAAYILDLANAVGSGAPDELGTNVAYGYTWVFGDTLANYVSGAPGFVVDNYYATATLAVVNVTLGTSYATIEAALAASMEGNVITVANGIYNPVGSLVINHGLTLSGESEAGVVINIPAAGGYGFSVAASNVVMENFTLVCNVANQNYPIHASGTTNLPGGFDNLTIRNATINGTHRRTGFDFNGYNNVVLSNLSSSDATGGNGLQVSGCVGVTMDNITALNNAWGSIAVYCSDEMGRPSSNVTVDGATLNLDGAFFSQDEFGFFNSGIVVTGWDYEVTNTHFREALGLSDSEGYTFFVVDQATAYAMALGFLGYEQYSAMLNTASGEYEVLPGMTIQAAVEAASANDTIVVAAGTFIEPTQIFIDKNLILSGAGAGSTNVTPGFNTSAGSYIVANAFIYVDYGVTAVIENLTLDGTGQTVYHGVQSRGASLTVKNCDIRNMFGYTYDGRGLVFLTGTGLVENCTMSGIQRIGVHIRGGVEPVAPTVTVNNLNYTGKGIGDFLDYGVEVGGGGHGVIGACVVTNCLGVAAADGSGSSGVLVTDYYGTGSTCTLNGCTLTGNSNGMNVGYAETDQSVVAITGSEISGNDGFGVTSTGPVVDARGNWWGEPSGPFHSALNPAGLGNEVSDHVLFEPWVGQSFITAVPAVTGDTPCGQTVTVTFSLTMDAYTPDVFGYNAIVRATDAVDFGTIHNLHNFGPSGLFYTFDQGDDSFIISSTTVGDPDDFTPISGAGTYPLFSIDFTTATDGLGEITFDAFSLRDPSNAPIAASASGATILVDCTAPAAVTGVTCAPHHNKVEVNWTHDGIDVDHFAVYRWLAYDSAVGTSAYPEYNDLAGYTVPAAPADLGNPAWVPVADVTGVNTLLDESMLTVRGIYYYDVVAVDAAGNTSGVSNFDAATSYWLGDVDGSGTVVAYPDINDLGTAFGTAEGHGLYNNICDVGPTDDWSRVGLPTTDSRINFEDLMIFSMNFGVVSTTNKTMVEVASAAHLEWVTYDETHFGLRLIDGQGLKGVRVTASLPEGVIGDVVAGDLMDQQSEMTFLKNVGASLDVNLAVMGTGNGFTGSGDLFVVESSQPIAMEDLSIQLRGADNSEIEVSLDASSDTLTPRVFALNANYPNPFNPMTKISFSLPEAQNVSLVVYSLDGRKVATLVNETRQAGLHEVVWTGRNDAGHGVASGTYFYRINAGPYSSVHKMTLMK